MKKYRYLELALVSLAGLAMPAYADEAIPVTFTGFGTAAVTGTDTNDAEFARPNQAAGAKKAFRTGVDSNFGLQATYKLSDQFSFIAQGMVSKNAIDSYGAELTWAFLKYKMSDDFTLRLGRTTPPLYMISDFRHVGYANLMMRPPNEVYRQITVGSLEGADLIYQHSFDDTTVTAQLGWGSGERATTTPGAYVDFKSMATLHVVVENGPFTFRYGHVDTKFSFLGSTALTGLLAALRSNGQAAVADELNPYDVRGKFDSLGFGLDYKNFLVQAEYAKKKLPTRIVPSTTAWYTMLGYRYGKVTPYYYHGSSMQDAPRSFSGMPTTGPLAGLTAAANGATKAPQNSSNAIGVRWDFAKSVALKVQIDRVKPIDGSGGFAKPLPSFSGPVNVYAAGIDFVF